MHRNVAIPDYRSLVTQTSGMDIETVRLLSYINGGLTRGYDPEVTT